MKITRALGLALLAAFTVVVFAQDARIDYDHQVNFANFHSYSWQDTRTDDQLVESSLTAAVDQTLQSKGWRRVDSGGDVILAAVDNAHSQSGNHSYPAAIVVDMYDAQNKHLIWHGTVSDSSSMIEDADGKNPAQAIDKLFKGFPPK
jgi:hypothetical protein